MITCPSILVHPFLLVSFAINHAHTMTVFLVAEHRRYNSQDGRREAGAWQRTSPESEAKAVPRGAKEGALRAGNGASASTSGDGASARNAGGRASASTSGDGASARSTEPTRTSRCHQGLTSSGAVRGWRTNALCVRVSSRPLREGARPDLFGSDLPDELVARTPSRGPDALAR